MQSSHPDSYRIMEQKQRPYALSLALHYEITLVPKTTKVR